MSPEKKEEIQKLFEKLKEDVTVVLGPCDIVIMAHPHHKQEEACEGMSMHSNASLLEMHKMATHLIMFTQSELINLADAPPLN